MPVVRLWPLFLLLACGVAPRESAGPFDAADVVGTDAGGPEDAGAPPDAGSSAGPEDAGEALDAGEAAVPDAGQADAGTPAAPDPTVAGGFTWATVTAEVTRGQRITPVAALVPEGADRRPLLVFVPGFQIDSVQYRGLCEHLASHGFVVVRADPPDPLFGVTHTGMALDVRAVLDWALAQSPFNGRVDASWIALLGHSLGGKVTTMVAAEDARVKALFAIDPVNGGNPFTGYSAELPDIVPEVVARLTIPLGLPGETTNATGGGFSPPCAPADQNFQTFYAAATASPWVAQWDFTGADHMDFLDDPSQCGFTCSACPDGSADQVQVRTSLRTLAAGFFLRHLAGLESLEAYLVGDEVPGGVVVTARP